MICQLLKAIAMGMSIFKAISSRSFWAIQSNPRHIYIGSLSKLFAPGVRLGYLLADSPYFLKIVSRRHDAGSNYFASAGLAQLYEENLWPHRNQANTVLLGKRAEGDLHLVAADRWAVSLAAAA